MRVVTLIALIVLTVGLNSFAAPGVFTDSGQSFATAQTYGAAWGDLDGDGDNDVFVVNIDGGANTVWTNSDTDGTLTNSGQALGDSGSLSVALGDLDGDGDLDAFVGNDNQSSNIIWLNDGAGLFTNSGQSWTPDYSYSVALGDLDGDGDLDVFIGNGSIDSGEGNKVYLNDGSGTLTDTGQSLGSAWTTGVALADLDGDGDLDAFTSNRNSAPNKVWLNNGSGTFTDSGQNLGTANSLSVGLGDINGDGYTDAYVGNRSGDAVWLNNGSGTFTDSGQSIGTYKSHIGLKDLNMDGYLDVFLANESPNQVWINSGSGTFTDSTQTLGNEASMFVALGDADGDTDLDAFVCNVGGVAGTGAANKLWVNQTYTPARMTMVVSPEGTGTTTPAAGLSKIPQGISQALVATPATNYHFLSWSVDAGGTIADSTSATTTFTATAATVTVTATFERDTATLTMAVSGTGEGTTDPAVGPHVVNTQEAQTITATPAANNVFYYWGATDTAVVADTESATTTVTLTGGHGSADTVTANFAYQIEIPKVSISLDSNGDKDSVKISKATHPLTTIDTDTDAISIIVDGNEFACNDGTWKTTVKNDAVTKATYKSTSKTPGVSLSIDFVEGKRTWTAKISKGDFNDTFDNANGVWIFLQVNDALYGLNYPKGLDEKTSYSFKGNSTTIDPTTGYTAIGDFGVAQAAIKYDTNKPNKGSIKISKSSTGDLTNVPLDDEENNAVKILVGDYTYTVAAGDLEKHKSKNIYTYKDTGTPKIQLKIDLEKELWSYTMSKGDTSEIRATDGLINVRLQIGTTIEGACSIEPTIKSKLTNPD